MRPRAAPTMAFFLRPKCRAKTPPASIFHPGWRDRCRAFARPRAKTTYCAKKTEETDISTTETMFSDPDVFRASELSLVPKMAPFPYRTIAGRALAGPGRPGLSGAGARGRPGRAGLGRPGLSVGLSLSFVSHCAGSLRRFTGTCTTTSSAP